MISAIVAIDENYGIGYKGQLLESIPEDLKHFKELTTGHTVIMGFNTWMSLPVHPLPNRYNIVIVDPEDERVSVMEETPYHKFMTFEETLNYVLNLSKNEEVFIIGGGYVYKEFYPYYDKLYITKIYKIHDDIDTFFPRYNSLDHWNIIQSSELKTIEDNKLSYQFLELVKT